MTFSEIKTLLDAGFTKDEIMSISNPQNAQINPQPAEEQPKPSAEEQPKPPAEEQPKPPAEDHPEQLPEGLKILQNSITEMMKSNKELMEVIQASNLNNDSHGNNAIETIQTNAENALKAIINPLIRKKEE